MERASVARNSPNVVSINQLSSTLKTVEVGITGRVSKTVNDECLANLDELVDRCWIWSDEFMPAARQEYVELLSGEIDNSQIPEMRSNTMAFNATFVRILAGCYHQWVKNREDWKPLAEFIRAASLSPGAGRGSLLVEAGVVIPGGTTPIGRTAHMSKAVDHIVGQAEAANL